MQQGHRTTTLLTNHPVRLRLAVASAPGTAHGMMSNRIFIIIIKARQRLYRTLLRRAFGMVGPCNKKRVVF